MILPLARTQFGAEGCDDLSLGARNHLEYIMSVPFFHAGLCRIELYA